MRCSPFIPEAKTNQFNRSCAVVNASGRPIPARGA
jgi:hypothetical protein